MKKLLLFVPALAVSSCTKYTYNAIRSEKTTEEIVKQMTYNNTNATIQINDMKERKFAKEENELYALFTEEVKKNFSGKSSDKIDLNLNVVVKDVLKEEVECEKETTKINGGGFLFNALKLATAAAKAYAEKDKKCYKDFTYYTIKLNGVNVKDKNKDKLFESTTTYKTLLADEVSRTKEIKSMLSKVAKHIAENKASKI